MAADMPTVSVIVPTRNSEGTLNRCLRSIKEQTYPNVELIVVDNGSTDCTGSIAQHHADLVIEAGPERSAQRNRGVERARGSFVFIVDSDMVLSPEVVAECVAVARRDSASAIVVPERSEGEGWWGRAKVLERSCYVGDDTIEAARFFDREAYRKYGGYDESMTGPEDWDLPNRMRKSERFGRVHAWIVHLEGRPTLATLARKKYYYGRSLGSYIRRHPSQARRQVLFIRPAFVRHRRRLLHAPTLTLAMLFMKAVEHGAAGTGLLVELARTRNAKPPENSTVA